MVFSKTKLDFLFESFDQRVSTWMKILWKGPSAFLNPWKWSRAFIQLCTLKVHTLKVTICKMALKLTQKEQGKAIDSPVNLQNLFNKNSFPWNLLSDLSFAYRRIDQWSSKFHLFHWQAHFKGDKGYVINEFFSQKMSRCWEVVLATKNIGIVLQKWKKITR